MVTARRTIGTGPQSIAYTLSLMESWIEFYSTLPAIRSVALAIAGSAIDHDPAGQAAQLAQFVRDAVVYQADPIDSEYLQSPDLLLLQIHETGVARGDCDDHVILFCTLARALGIAATPAGVRSPGATEIDHVIASVALPGRNVDIDLCAKWGFEPNYTDKVFPP